MGQRILVSSGVGLLSSAFDGEHHYRVVADPIPADVRIRNVTLEFPYSANHDTVAFLLESAEWDDVPDGAPIPNIAPLFQVIHIHPAENDQ